MDFQGKMIISEPNHHFSTPLLFQLTMVLLWSFFNNYNKSYAMLYISDDKFLAVAAIIQNVMNGSCRLFFGFLFDRLGFKVVINHAFSKDCP